MILSNITCCLEEFRGIFAMRHCRGSGRWLWLRTQRAGKNNVFSASRQPFLACSSLRFLIWRARWMHHLLGASRASWDKITLIIPEGTQVFPSLLLLGRKENASFGGVAAAGAPSAPSLCDVMTSRSMPGVWKNPVGWGISTYCYLS